MNVGPSKGEKALMRATKSQEAGDSHDQCSEETRHIKITHTHKSDKESIAQSVNQKIGQLRNQMTANYCLADKNVNDMSINLKN